MAYVDRRPQENRTIIIGVVAVIHGLAAYAIVTGLAHDFTREVLTIIKAYDVPDDPPPPPPPLPDPPMVEPKPQQIDRPDRLIDIPIDDLYQPPVAPEPTDRLITVIEPPLPPVPPRFTPQLAKPSNNISRWATTSDYPTQDLRLGNQGVTGFKLIVGTTGLVESCVITRSSGYAGLDDATCRKVSQRAKFKPATDGNGQPTSGEFSSRIRWEIPE